MRKPEDDPIVLSVIGKYHQRSRAGIEKYGATLEENELPFREWITHAQEEAMDFALYLEKMQKVNDRVLALLHNALNDKGKRVKYIEEAIEHLR